MCMGIPPHVCAVPEERCVPKLVNLITFSYTCLVCHAIYRRMLTLLATSIERIWALECSSSYSTCASYYGDPPMHALSKTPWPLYGMATASIMIHAGIAAPRESIWVREPTT